MISNRISDIFNPEKISTGVFTEGIILDAVEISDWLADFLNRPCHKREDLLCTRLKFLADRFFVGLFCVIMASLSGCDFLLPKETVYVTVPILNLREKPTTKSQVVERLQRGRELEIFERANPWLHVRVDGKN